VASDPSFRPTFIGNEVKELGENPKYEWFTKLMRECWDHNEEKRPTFEKILDLFRKNANDKEEKSL